MSVNQDLLAAGWDAVMDNGLPCGHDWRVWIPTPRLHVGDFVCYRCKRQALVYDWDLYNSLASIPEPGKRGSLQAVPQRGPR